MSIRAQIVSEIIKLVQPHPVPMDYKPSIAEIEKMLNSDNPNRITLAPDGSAMLVAHGHTVGDIADAVLRIVQPKMNRLESALRDLVDALTANDEDGLTEFADVMCAARAALNNKDNK